MTGHSNSTTKRKRPSRARRQYAADFETTTLVDDCRVWVWGIAELDKPETFEYDTTLDTFIERIELHGSITYFHNLRFDGHFIVDWMLKNGYTHATGDGQTMRSGTFKTLMSSLGKLFSITVQWFNGNKTEFRDSLKKLPMSLSKVADAFKLDEAKGELDYNAPRPLGHIPTPEEIEYLRIDVVILCKAMGQVVRNGMTRLTVASDSLAEYKKLITTKGFLRTFPILADWMDAEIRRALRGGFTYADPRFSQRKVGAGLVLDVNSLYPAVMKNELLPYGEPEWVEDEVVATERRPLTVFSVTFTAKIKPNHIPCIQIKGTSMFSATEYLSEIEEPTTLMVTNVDWELYNEHYNIDVLAYGGGWRFHAARGMFDAYIDKWSRIKEHSTGGIRAIAKLHLNSLFGKFGSNPDVTSKYPELGDDDAVHWVRGMDDQRAPVYTAMAVFITAYARALTIRAAQANYGTFAYADTDSLHLLTDEVPEGLEVHPTKMGAWKIEYYFTNAFYVRPKAYIEQTADGEYVNRVAGLPEQISAQITFDDITNGKVFEGKLKPVSVPGGIVLLPIEYKLKW